MSVGQRIKNRRKEIKMSADEIAEKLNVSRSTIFRYEKGDIEKLPTNIIEELADILQTTPGYLMGWEDASKITDISSIYSQLDKNRQDKVYEFANQQLEEQTSKNKMSPISMKIIALCNRDNITISDLEKLLELTNISEWDHSVPFENVKKVADFFNVTPFYLLGVYSTPIWASAKDVEELKSTINKNSTMAFGGENLTKSQNQRVKDIIASVFWEEKGKLK